MSNTTTKAFAGTNAIKGGAGGDDAAHVCTPNIVANLADMGASTAAQILLGQVQTGIDLKAAYIVPSVALTANNTNYKTFSLSVSDTLTGTQTVLDSFTTQITGSGDWVAKTAEAFTIAATDALTVGQYLWLEIDVAGSGVATPAMTAMVEYKLTA